MCSVTRRSLVHGRVPWSACAVVIGVSFPVETLEWLDSIWSQSNFAGRKGLPDVGRDPLRPYFGRDRLLPESALLTTASPRPTIYCRTISPCDAAVNPSPRPGACRCLILLDGAG